MKKLYTSVVFIAAFMIGNESIQALRANVEGFATQEVPGVFSITCIGAFVVFTIALFAYKLTPKI